MSQLADEVSGNICDERSEIDFVCAEAEEKSSKIPLEMCHASVKFVERISISYARRHGVMGVLLRDGDAVDVRDQDKMILAVGEHCDEDVVDVLRRLLGVTNVRVMAFDHADVLAKINQAYQQQTGQADAVIDRLEVNKDNDLGQLLNTTSGGREDLLDIGSRAPVIKLVNLILFEAVKAEASDVHIQPYEDRLVVRLRIDGVLFDAYTLPRGVLEEMVSRVKVMGKMNIAEKRLPQDGRATVQVGDRVVDLRISSVPSSHGERIVIRLLDKGARLHTLSELGMRGQTYEEYRSLIGVEHGLILVTGPTGSGKSTTLYASLSEINSKRSNILTLEDPIEYQLDGISQIQVSEKKGMTFASGLRSVLRQDPDIVMVGEIRDHETAVLAIQAALTGHLVFSTLHTNDAASAITRLLDLGIEPYLVASSLVGVMAQRLVRRVCTECGQFDDTAVAPLHRLNLDEKLVDVGRMRVGSGCETCRETGYRGRVGLYELLTVNEPIRELVQTRSTAAQIKQAAIQSLGMRPLRESGIEKVLSGVTTVDEILRVTMREISGGNV
ncbi:Type II secretion system protein E [Poriferisphaera corsica]|uniref:Type II secretion system protein E n=1 Tax=Poriferisphaera corsica TaxID=2528020 RepID=A0A517YWJ5_9BACT|nr:ATPase, T2SS/T4P/T4SS family [Poriferisphaera corsica]QDU34579.1 Type II secretion system protein E [Poriferisphaera corsica]